MRHSASTDTSRTVHVDLAERAYDIIVGKGIDVGAAIPADEVSRVLLVTDTNVDPLYAARWEQGLATAGLRTAKAVVPAGESSKSLDRARFLYDQALSAGLDRKSLVLALGGGMVGDLGGFVAATFLRGIRLVQAPTSLLAMVDSSVGGKTAVNLPQGKNLVGVFHQPASVLVDLDALETLPEREYLSGMAEVVKYGVIWDAVLLARLEDGVDRLRARDAVLLTDVVARCCEIKAEVVGVDEREAGVRAILNFGHTLAHALESTAGYGRWLHGEAVSVGMVYAAALSEGERGLAEQERRRLTTLLERLGLPVSPAASGERPAWEAVRRAMAADKKSREAMPRLVLAERFGSAMFGCEVAEDVLAETFAAL